MLLIPRRSWTEASTAEPPAHLLSLFLLQAIKRFVWARARTFGLHYEFHLRALTSSYSNWRGIPSPYPASLRDSFQEIAPSTPKGLSPFQILIQPWCSFCSSLVFFHRIPLCLFVVPLAFADTNPSMLFDSNDFIAPPALLSSSLLHTIPWVVPGLPQSPSWPASFPSALIPWPISQFESLLWPLRWLSDFCLWFRLACYSQIDFRSLN